MSLRPRPALVAALLLAGLPALGLAQPTTPVAGGGRNPAPFQGPIFRAPDQTVEWVMRAQQTACQVAGASSDTTELKGLELAVNRIIEARAAAVRKAVADSAPGVAARTALETMEPRLKRLEDRLDPLILQRNGIRDSLALFRDSIAVATRGDAAPGQPGDLESIEATMKSLDDEHARYADELSKIKDADNWLQGRDEQLRALMEENRTRWRRERDRRRGILTRVHRARYDPTYIRLIAREEAVDREIQPLEEQIKPLRQAIQRHKDTLKDVDLKAVDNLEMLHEISGLVSQYMEGALDCIEDRRRTLASTVPPQPPGAPPVEGGFAGSAVGQWTSRCTWNDPSIEPSSLGGTFRVAFEGAGMVSGTYISGTGSYAVTGIIGADGVANGQGVGNGWSLNWQGRFDQSTGVTIGNGSVNVTVTDFGGGTCTGGWSTP